MARLTAALLPLATIAGIALGTARGPAPAAATLVAAGVIGFGAFVGRSAQLRAGVLVVAVGVLACALAQRALDGASSGHIVEAAVDRADAIVVGTVTDDPSGTRWATHLLVRVDSARVGRGGRVRVVHEHRTIAVDAGGDAAGRLAVLGVGDRVVLGGWLSPLGPDDGRDRWRHVAARLDVLELVDVAGPRSILLALSEPARAVVLRGTDLLAPTERALAAGFLLGDTRDLPPEVLDDFRRSGLSHLLAVSGANVAFVLALLAPLLRRSPRTARLVLTAITLLVFGAMTRWEPSVLRACAMASVALVSAHVGRPARGVRVLSLAVTVLLLVDPFLLHSVGFLLSCGASLGITLFAAPLVRCLRGPAWLRESVGTTVAAQLGVAPVLLPVFGSVPLVSVPANLLAVPLAGPLTTWGLTGGAVAGWIRPRAPVAASLLQLPTRVLSQALLGLADIAARAPLALDLGGVLAASGAAGLVGVIAGARRRRSRRMLRERALVVPPR